MRDRLGQSQPEARTFIGSARVQPSEAAYRLDSPVARNAGTAIADLDANESVRFARRDGDLSAGISVANRILDEVAHGLLEQLPVTEQGQWRAGLVERQRRIALLRQRFVHLHQLGAELSRVEPGELV